jgi:heme-degrading monooxygenase HmoA
MIIREWRGRADAAREDAYPKHFREKVVLELRTVQGFVGAQLSRRAHLGKIEYLVLTRLQSMDAIRAFADADVTKAVVEPGAMDALADFDSRVQHYEVVEDVTA